MLDLLTESLIDALKMLPFLIAVYIIIEFLEHKAMDKIRAAFSSERLGVVSAAALGLFPQCGFSVAAANLYAKKIITAGTLIAVFISTSDEAIPIFASDKDSIKWLFPLLAIKFLYAIIAGFIVNFIFSATGIDRDDKIILNKPVNTHKDYDHKHCNCKHCNCNHSNSGIIKNAVFRALSIFLFILATNLILNLIIYRIGEDSLAILLMTDSMAQPFIAALIGLIPNCAASVVLSELFISGALSFGSLTAGLSAGAGVGLVVLFKVNRNMKQNFILLGILYAFSAVIGIILQMIVR